MFGHIRGNGKANTFKAPRLAKNKAYYAYHLALHTLTFGLTRFRLPMVPFLILAAAPLYTRSWGPLVAARPRWQLALLVAGWGLLIMLWASRWHTSIAGQLSGQNKLEGQVKVLLSPLAHEALDYFQVQSVEERLGGVRIDRGCSFRRWCAFKCNLSLRRRS